jgi:hypothetical protein
MNPGYVIYDHGFPVKDRETKLAKKRGQQKLNGRALKRLLNERAAKAQRGRTDGEAPQG